MGHMSVSSRKNKGEWAEKESEKNGKKERSSNDPRKPQRRTRSLAGNPLSGMKKRQKDYKAIGGGKSTCPWSDTDCSR